MLKIAVIGVGSLGQHHARNYEQMQDVELVALVDSNFEQAKKVAEKIIELKTAKKPNFLNKLTRLFFSNKPVVSKPQNSVNIPFQQNASKVNVVRTLAGTSVISEEKKDINKTVVKIGNIEVLVDYRELVGKVDAVSIASPTPLHHEIAKFCLQNGIHCLVEKPITSTLEQADELIEIASKNNLVLQIGHIERFNPAIIELQDFVKQPKYIEINRLGPYSARVAHIGVVLDLMVHDLDMVLFLTNSEVESVDAIGTRVISDHEDIANVRLKFKNGCVASISASRVSLDKFRKIRIFQPDSYISLDYEHQSFKLYRKKSNVDKIEKLTDIDIQKFSPQKGEPLHLELLDFVDCVINHKKPKVGGIHGRRALKLALDVVEKINEGMNAGS